MWNTVALVIAIILCLCVIAGVAYIINRSLLLDDLEEELKKYSADLDERANRISQEEEDLRARVRESRGLNINMASYTVTEADDIRTFVEMHKWWVEKPLLVANEELAEKARLICKENHIPIKIEVVKAKWKK